MGLTGMMKASNAIVGFLVDTLGLNLKGAEVLEVRGRKTGEPHRVPVNPVMVDGVRYLFAPRGETTWVKNIRVSGEGTLHKGRRSTRIRVEEVANDEKPSIIRAYLDRWGWQVGNLVAAPKNATDEQLREIAPNHPVFRITASDDS
jgi:deazaflavin-dependent oxidoreductase (nitroreductase family)